MDSTKITVTNMRIIVEDQKEDSPGADGMWHVLGLLQAVCGVLLRGLLRHQDDPEPGAGAQPGASRDVQGAPLAASREVPLKRIGGLTAPRWGCGPLRGEVTCIFN